MVMLQVSDYLPNSLFYHAHKFVFFLTCFTDLIQRNMKVRMIHVQKMHMSKVTQSVIAAPELKRNAKSPFAAIC
ncbi:hypothetical protein ANCDUO_15332 [Ancylostoma duodenale]|uniref:Uncharacterized protein n=1 Tax=Ancylostoma duodenale TaxID=51022 RepID=A0A0C2G0T2_9BILA|nr:hypothetical protein ANCDUO_15332 [Ancylostoma duodenale]